MRHNLGIPVTVPADSLPIASKKNWGISLDRVWLLAVLAAVFIVISILEIEPNDFWWHLKIGQIIYQTGKIPNTNMFSWSLPADHPFIYGEWLGEYLLYVVYQVGSIPLTLFIKNLITLIALALVGWETIRRTGSWRIAGMVVALTFGMSANNMGLRPQIWSWIPFVVFYMLLSAYADGQLKPGWLLVLPAVMIFWVNAHGAYILGIILIGIFFCGEALRTYLKMVGALSWRGVGLIAGTGALTVLATVVNPQFVNIFFYVYKLMTDSPSQSLIIEWQSPEANNYTGWFFYGSILLLLVALAYSRFRLTPSRILLILPFLWLAWSGLRYVVWYGIVAMPILGEIFYEIVKNKKFMEVPPKNPINLVLVGALVIPAILLQPWFIDRMPLPVGFWQKVYRDIPQGPMLSIHNPVGAVEYLSQHPGGNLFNEMGYGSYMIWASPQQKVFIDPRVELYPLEQWKDYIRISLGVRETEMLAKYKIDRILLRTVDFKELTLYLQSSPDWQMEYSDAYSQIWKKVPQK